jgi:hypothetical protein
VKLFCGSCVRRRETAFRRRRNSNETLPALAAGAPFPGRTASYKALLASDFTGFSACVLSPINTRPPALTYLPFCFELLLVSVSPGKKAYFPEIFW